MSSTIGEDTVQMGVKAAQAWLNFTTIICYCCCLFGRCLRRATQAQGIHAEYRYGQRG